MKKIVLVLENFDESIEPKSAFGGASRVTHKILSQWVKCNDVELTIVCATSTFNEYQGIKKILAIGGDIWYHINLLVDYLSKLNEEETFDSILFPDLYSPYMSVVLQAHSALYRCKLLKPSFLQGFYKYNKRNRIDWERSRFSEKNKSFIAMSEKVKQDYVENLNLDNNKVFVVYPGVDLPPEPSYKLEDRPFTFGIVAHNNLNKGAHRFLTAFARIKKHNINALIICSGTGLKNILEWMIKLFGLKNKVKIIDFQRDMSKFYSSVDCLVLPSQHEGFGLVATEACAYGVIPLVSSFTGVSEIIDDGANGLVFDMDKSSIKNLADKMLMLVSSDSEKLVDMKKNARKLAEKYTWSDFAQKILEVL